LALEEENPEDSDLIEGMNDVEGGDSDDTKETDSSKLNGA